MSNRSRPFKDTQVFDWQTEPKDERPSEFVPSTGFSSLSGYYAMPPDARVYRRRSGMGAGTLLLAALLVIVLGATVLLGFMHLIRG